MAITVYQTPEDYTPGFSPQIFTAVSNQTGQPNFKYTVVCTELDSLETRTYQIAPRSDAKLVFDAKAFSEIFLEHYVPKNEYGWKLCTNGLLNIRVNIGETYGSTPAYASGSNSDFYVWNGILDFKTYPIYDPINFVYDVLTSNIVYLNRNEIVETYEDRSDLLYALTSQRGDAYSIQIKTYDSSDVLIDTFAIDNPYTYSTDYREKYVCIDVGYKGLTEISAGLVNGTPPILTDQVAYYDLYDVSDDGFMFNFTFLKRVYIRCEPRYPVYLIHYLDKSGCFQSLPFNKLSEETLSKQQTTYNVLPYTYESNVYSYLPSANIRKTLNSERTNKLKLSTDWMDEDQIEYFQGIIDSPLVYLDQGSGQDYLQVSIVSDSYKLNKKYNERIYAIALDFEYAHTNARQ